MDRLYREVRLGVVTPEMGRVLFGILTRILDSELLRPTASKPNGRARADRVRPKLRIVLTRAERTAWNKAIADGSSTLPEAEPAELEKASTPVHTPAPRRRRESVRQWANDQPRSLSSRVTQDDRSAL